MSFDPFSQSENACRTWHKSSSAAHINSFRFFARFAFRLPETEGALRNETLWDYYALLLKRNPCAVITKPFQNGKESFVERKRFVTTASHMIMPRGYP